MNWDVLKIFTLVAIAFSVGCTDVNPTVSMLKSLENGFEFQSSQITTTSLFSVPLQATCSSYIQKVEMSFDGSNWISPSDYDANTKSVCENGAFVITLSDTKTPWKTTTFTQGEIIAVKFRAVLSAGASLSREVKITYKPSSSLSQEILAGAGTQTGTGFILRGKVRAQYQEIASGGNFKIRGRILK